RSARRRRIQIRLARLSVAKRRAADVCQLAGALRVHAQPEFGLAPLDADWMAPSPAKPCATPAPAAELLPAAGACGAPELPEFPPLLASLLVPPSTRHRPRRLPRAGPRAEW